MRARPWSSHPSVEIIEGDLAQVADNPQWLAGCQVAYYLVHSMVTAGPEYVQRDQRIAEAFSRSAASSDVERIIYLGGLGETGADLSRHLSSRRDVEGALATGGVPVTVLRAAMIIGSGSASFEILRYLVERLPIMITPRWVRTESQPIAVRNVLTYLVSVLDAPQTAGRTLDIGGPDVMNYREIMDVMASVRGLPKRIIIPVPVLTPRLSSLWIHLVTPISQHLGRPLAEGLRNRVVCRDAAANELMPQRLLTVRESIEAALGRISAGSVETAWSDAGLMPGDPDWAGGTTFVDRRTITVRAGAADVFRAVCRVGGRHGYHAANWLWHLRGAMDRLVGGPGLRRGRRNPEEVGYGDALDFWRVTDVEADRRLELRAEMRLPGEALLAFDIESDPEDTGSSRLVQTARFKPKGLLGLVYWCLVLPLHGVVFRGMLRGIRQTAETQHRQKSAVVRDSAARSRLVVTDAPIGSDQPEATADRGTCR